MFQGARQLPNDRRLDADIGIVDSGTAGTTLAKELIEAGDRVLVLESHP